ncbi:MAG TPA: FkbM family methyltransferase [Bacteroidales bacterium]|nr:FkbM family methyltransferase [Bacteroidales bacterium]
MKFIRIILYKILGTGNYVNFVSYLYLQMVKLGLLKNKYPELFFLKNLIKPCDTCIDIGANVGYYSFFMLKHMGNSGKLYAIEPVEMFRRIWQKRIPKSKKAQYTLFPYALGEENVKVTMGTPSINGVVHHGMTKIIDKIADNIVAAHEVEMRIPDELFENIPNINFLKIDVEGYESIVFDNMHKTIKRTLPIIQAELSGKQNRHKVINLLQSYGYSVCILDIDKLKLLRPELVDGINSDLYFIPESKKELFC